MTLTLYHYTCTHGREGIGDSGTLVGARHLIPPTEHPAMNDWRAAMFDLVWMTDLSFPIRGALGLSSYTLRCDRTEFRYRVTNACTARHWPDVRRSFDPRIRRGLETELAAMPMHWWVSTVPVPVVFDPVKAA
jgi:hypothetical protein